MIRAIIFDCFGVLVGSSFKDIFRQAGGDLERDEPFVDDVLTAANSGFIAVSDMHQQVANHLGISLEAWLDFFGAREQPNAELLDYIKTLKKDYKLAVMSNANHGVLPRVLAPEQQALFDVMIASADVGYMKPDPPIYLLTAERLGVEPAECIAVDDREAYCQAAEAVGMKSVWYQNFDQFQRDITALLT